MGPRSTGFTVRWHFPAPKAVLFIDFLLVGVGLLTVKTAQLDKIPNTTPLYLAKGADAVTQSLHLQGSIMHFSHHSVATMIGEDTVGWEGLSRSGITEISNECSLQVHGLNSGHHYTHKPSGLMCVCNQKQKEGGVHHSSVVEHRLSIFKTLKPTMPPLPKQRITVWHHFIFNWN